MSKSVCQFRAMLEDDHGTFHSSDDLREGNLEPDVVEGIALGIKRDIKDAIGGLAPIYGKAQILAMVMDVMGEDDRPGGPQTMTRTEIEDERERQSDESDAGSAT